MLALIKKVKRHLHNRWVIFTVAAILLTPRLLFAQEDIGGPGTGDNIGGSNPQNLINPLRFTSIQAFINAILNIVITIGIPISVFFIVYAGFLFVTAAGNEEKVKKARSTFLWTVVGVAILLGASLLASILKNTINQIQS